MSRPRVVIEAELLRAEAELRALPDSVVRAGFAEDYLGEIETLKEELAASPES